MPELAINYWLIRSPYQNRTWDDCLMRNLFRLQGIRNTEAARNIGRMQPGDQVLFYNNIGERAVFGILEVSVKPYTDPTSNESCWLADMSASEKLRPVGAVQTGRPDSRTHRRGFASLGDLRGSAVHPLASRYFQAPW